MVLKIDATVQGDQGHNTAVADEAETSPQRPIDGLNFGTITV